MNPAEQPAPSALPAWNTLLRVVARVVLALGASFLVDLGALALLPHSASFVTRLMQSGLPKVPGNVYCIRHPEDDHPTVHRPFTGNSGLF